MKTRRARREPPRAPNLDRRSFEGVARLTVTDGVESRQALRSRLAVWGIAFVLVAVSVFAIWASQVTAVASARAAQASRVSDAFATAASAIETQESLEFQYRLEPGPGVRAQFDAESVRLVAALERAREGGGVEEADVVRRALLLHRGYLWSIEKLFAAVDSGDDAEVIRIDEVNVDPAFTAIGDLLSEEAVTEHAVAIASIEELQRLERITRTSTPAVFVAGLLLVGRLGAVTRRYGLLLRWEREKAVHLSLHDALTGLPSRPLLFERIDAALEVDAATGSTTGLLLIDLDRFKDVNDTFGHHYGNVLLAQIGPRLQAHVREGDTIARLGGDEFAVLLPDIGDLEAATAVARALQRALETPFQVEGIDLDVEASIGIVLSGEHGSDTATLIRRVDIAMYVAKRNNLAIFAYEPEYDKHSPERLALLGELRRAVDNDELFLHFQPKVSLSTGEVIGAEALVRWAHPTLGTLYPDSFVPTAEHTGLIWPITRCVLTAALDQAVLWSEAGHPLPVAVNLSARNLLDEQLPGQVADLLAARHLPASLLKLEVTESAIMADPKRAARLLRQLADLGVKISIDDFGAGYTSLGQLKSLPITELKIDKSFVLNMNDEDGDALIVHSVVDLGHNLGLSIVAEGVENELTLAQLAAYGCDAAQGYHLCRPVPAVDFDAWRATHEARLVLTPVVATASKR